MPFLRILPVVVAGIVFGDEVPLPSAIAMGAAVVAGLCAAVWRRRWVATTLVALGLFLFAMAMTGFTATRLVMPTGQRLVMTLRVTDIPTESGRWSRATAVVDDYRLLDGGERWSPANEKVTLYVDTAHRISLGQRLIATGRASEIASPGYEGYARLMMRRGYGANVWVGAREEVVVLPGVAQTPKYYAALMQASANRRLERLDLSPESLEVCRAMSLGARGGMSAGIRESYGLTGASHLLAVSGLHLGIVAGIINLLLWLLPSFRYGHVVKNVLAVAVIWLYAMTTGLSASVVRAAMMFTGVQVAFATSRGRSSLNIMLGTATVMLLLNPNYLYDVSFQLSFVAVMGIFLLYKPIYRIAASRLRVGNALWSVFSVGVAATLATLPLVSYHFGSIPVAGVLINPLVIVTATIIVFVALLWVVAPVGALSEVFSWILDNAAALQNRVVEVTAEKSWASLPIQLDAWQTGTVYAVAAAIWMVLRWARPENKYIDLKS